MLLIELMFVLLQDPAAGTLGTVEIESFSVGLALLILFCAVTELGTDCDCTCPLSVPPVVCGRAELAGEPLVEVVVEV